MPAKHLYDPPGIALARQDFLILATGAIQAAMLLTGMETREEVRVILVSHLVGTVMGIFKSAAGWWVYPEPGLLHIGAMPLFTGFMAAAVGTYRARA